MKKILTFLMILLALIVLSSCTNDAKDPMDEEIDSWETVFCKYWDAMSLEYVHFSEETDLDWDAVYEKYLPLFKELDFEKKEDSITAFKYFKEMAWQLSDYHYALIITDNFNNMLKLSPSTLQKMKKEHPDWDINDYPDVICVTDEGYQGYTSVNRGLDNPYFVLDGSKPDLKEVMKYLGVVEGELEVKKLTYNESEQNVFHGGTSETFGTMWCGATISKATAKTTDDGTSGEMSERDEAWNTVCEALGFDSEFTYFYGLTKEGGYFYYYLSAFPSTACLEPLLYQKELTAEERKTLENKGLDYVHDALWYSSEDGNLSKERAQLEGIRSLMKNLRYIGAMSKCTFDGYTLAAVNGVIMDVRSNGGGAADFLFTLMGSFFAGQTKIGSVRYRDSYSRYNYTPWIDYYLENEYCNPIAETNYSGPFVVITNGSSVSCSEISCMIAKLLPSTKIVGGQTYGGTCALTDRTIFQSGPFNAGQIYIYTTTYQSVDSNGNNLETIGITPDVAVKYTDSSTDERFAEAIETIKSMSADV